MTRGSAARHRMKPVCFSAFATVSRSSAPLPREVVPFFTRRKQIGVPLSCCTGMFLFDCTTEQHKKKWHQPAKTNEREMRGREGQFSLLLHLLTLKSGAV